MQPVSCVPDATVPTRMASWLMWIVLPAVIPVVLAMLIVVAVLVSGSSVRLVSVPVWFPSRYAARLTRSVRSRVRVEVSFLSSSSTSIAPTS